jgi:hypothetical protein
MTRPKDEWIQATGGLFASSDERQVRKRIHELAVKLKTNTLTEAERSEYLRLVDSLLDTEE